jgi:GxxExxY protein
MQSPPTMAQDFDDPQTYKIIGAAMAVHRELGCGFLEAVSREAFAIELQERGIPFVREARLPVRYHNRVLPLSYTVDFICYDEILVELKALRAIGPIEVAQVINYLRIAGRSRGLLLNFGNTSLQHQRLVLDLANDPKRKSAKTSGGAA